MRERLVPGVAFSCFSIVPRKGITKNITNKLRLHHTLNIFNEVLISIKVHHGRSTIRKRLLTLHTEKFECNCLGPKRHDSHNHLQHKCRLLFSWVLMCFHNVQYVIQSSHNTFSKAAAFCLALLHSFIL